MGGDALLRIVQPRRWRGEAEISVVADAAETVAPAQAHDAAVPARARPWGVIMSILWVALAFEFLLGGFEAGDACCDFFPLLSGVVRLFGHAHPF